MRILLLEDDRILGPGLRDYLLADGHVVDWCETLAQARLMVKEPYDLLLVDWQLPDGSGIDWIHQLRERGEEALILVLTARDRLQDRVHGLDSGADDYLVKPIELEELEARMRAFRRRSLTRGTTALQWHDWVIDFQARSVCRAGVAVVELTSREWSLLEALATRAGRVVPKADLEALLIGFQTEISSNALEVHVSNLRRKLGKDIVQTVRGLGYRMGT